MQIMRDQAGHNDLSPMAMLISLMANLSQAKHEYALTEQSEPTRYATQESRDFHIHKVLGQMPALAAAVYRVHTRQELVPNDPSLGYVANFLQMIFGRDHNLSQNAEIVRAVEQLMIL